MDPAEKASLYAVLTWVSLSTIGLIVSGIYLGFFNAILVTVGISGFASVVAVLVGQIVYKIIK